MAGLINSFKLFSAFFEKEDLNDVLQTGCYGLRSSGGVYAGILLVFAYENTKIQVVLGYNYEHSPIKRFRYTQIWTNTFLDWVEL